MVSGNSTRGTRIGDAGEGLIDADSRIQERMEELQRERAQKNARPAGNLEQLQMLESLRLARTELERASGGPPLSTARD